MAEGQDITPTGSGGSDGQGGGASGGINFGAVQSRVASAMKRGDIAMALGFIMILVVMMFPMPPWLLDFMLALSISFSVLILMTSLFIQKPLEFNSFPTILLVATSLRTEPLLSAPKRAYV